ncbi:uncharacterized protein IL334_005268 [Kwoniella shivajii]|uniref:Uncharacterized protein n=1 Tax=Kwoniella shivajii TaxID=564305 RepID=A0ABZ1D6L3_9TREE|nr:hypothetical protein IL334_005268 [Kwoniella shivajii]
MYSYNTSPNPNQPPHVLPYNAYPQNRQPHPLNQSFRFPPSAIAPERSSSHSQSYREDPGHSERPMQLNPPSSSFAFRPMETTSPANDGMKRLRGYYDDPSAQGVDYRVDENIYERRISPSKKALARTFEYQFYSDYDQQAQKKMPGHYSIQSMSHDSIQQMIPLHPTSLHIHHHSQHHQSDRAMLGMSRSGTLSPHFETEQDHPYTYTPPPFNKAWNNDQSPPASLSPLNYPHQGIISPTLSVLSAPYNTCSPVEQRRVVSLSPHHGSGELSPFSEKRYRGIRAREGGPPKAVLGGPGGKTFDEMLSERPQSSPSRNEYKAQGGEILIPSRKTSGISQTSEPRWKGNQARFKPPPTSYSPPDSPPSSSLIEPSEGEQSAEDRRPRKEAFPWPEREILTSPSGVPLPLSPNDVGCAPVREPSTILIRGSGEATQGVWRGKEVLVSIPDQDCWKRIRPPTPCDQGVADTEDEISALLQPTSPVSNAPDGPEEEGDGSINVIEDSTQLINNEDKSQEKEEDIPWDELPVSPINKDLKNRDTEESPKSLPVRIESKMRAWSDNIASWEDERESTSSPARLQTQVETDLDLSVTCFEDTVVEDGHNTVQDGSQNSTVPSFSLETRSRSKSKMRGWGDDDEDEASRSEDEEAVSSPARLECASNDNSFKVAHEVHDDTCSKSRSAPSRLVPLHMDPSAQSLISSPGPSKLHAWAEEVPVESQTSEQKDGNNNVWKSDEFRDDMNKRPAELQEVGERLVRSIKARRPAHDDVSDRAQTATIHSQADKKTGLSSNLLNSRQWAIKQIGKVLAEASTDQHDETQEDLMGDYLPLPTIVKKPRLDVEQIHPTTEPFDKRQGLEGYIAYMTKLVPEPAIRYRKGKGPSDLQKPLLGFKVPEINPTAEPFVPKSILIQPAAASQQSLYPDAAPFFPSSASSNFFNSEFLTSAIAHGPSDLPHSLPPVTEPDASHHEQISSSEIAKKLRPTASAFVPPQSFAASSGAFTFDFPARNNSNHEAASITSRNNEATPRLTENALVFSQNSVTAPTSTLFKPTAPLLVPITNSISSTTSHSEAPITTSRRFGTTGPSNSNEPILPSPFRLDDFGRAPAALAPTVSSPERGRADIVAFEPSTPIGVQSDRSHHDEDLSDVLRGAEVVPHEVSGVREASPRPNEGSILSGSFDESTDPSRSSFSRRPSREIRLSSNHSEENSYHPLDTPSVDDVESVIPLEQLIINSSLPVQPPLHSQSEVNAAPDAPASTRIHGPPNVGNSGLDPLSPKVKHNAQAAQGSTKSFPLIPLQTPPTSATFSSHSRLDDAQAPEGTITTGAYMTAEGSPVIPTSRDIIRMDEHVETMKVMEGFVDCQDEVGYRREDHRTGRSTAPSPELPSPTSCEATSMQNVKTAGVIVDAIQASIRSDDIEQITSTLEEQSNILHTLHKHKTSPLTRTEFPELLEVLTQYKDLFTAIITGQHTIMGKFDEVASTQVSETTIISQAIESLRSATERYSTYQDEQNSQIAPLRKEIDDYKSRLSESRTGNDLLKRRLEDGKREIEELKDQLKSTITRMEEMTLSQQNEKEGQVNQIARTIAAESERDHLAKTLNEKGGIEQDLRAELREYQEQLEKERLESRVKLSEKESQITVLKSQLQANDLISQLVSTSASALDEMSQDTMTFQDEMMNRISKLDENVHESMGNRDKEYEIVLDRNRFLQGEVDTLHQRLEGSADRFAKLQSSISDTLSSNASAQKSLTDQLALEAQRREDTEMILENIKKNLEKAKEETLNWNIIAAERQAMAKMQEVRLQAISQENVYWRQFALEHDRRRFQSFMSTNPFKSGEESVQDCMSVNQDKIGIAEHMRRADDHGTWYDEKK